MVRITIMTMVVAKVRITAMTTATVVEMDMTTATAELDMITATRLGQSGTPIPMLVKDMSTTTRMKAVRSV
jgi:hypothetical protein